MPRLIIDDRDIEVPKGTKVIDAAEALGIMIPRFCYHKALGAVGACRLCAVKFIHGPFKGVQMSCMLDAMDGMVVSTDHPEAVRFRRYIIEWLMLNHPHDCPVCDEGGHCLLQDETVSGGHGLRRYPGLKRTFRDQYLGPFIEHEMNRCIQCYRCSRFYQDYTGYRDLGAMQTANRVYFGRFEDGVLESPFAGNLIDVCPTGVYTDKPSRYSVRRWDMERGPGLCIHCSLGCNLIAAARFRELVRQQARVNEAVNGWFICDRGRYAFAYTNQPQRPRQALWQHKPVAMKVGIEEAGRRLTPFLQHGSEGSLRCLAGPHQSLESMAMLAHLCRTRGWQPPVYFEDRQTRFKVLRAVKRLDETLACSMREIEHADAVLAIGVDPLQEAPMLALAMRQAFCKGAPVVVLDPRPVRLPAEFIHIPLSCRNLTDGLRVMLREILHRTEVESMGAEALAFFDMPAPGIESLDPIQERLTDVAHRLIHSKRPVLICGTQAAPLSLPDLAADAAVLLGKLQKQSRLFYLLPGADSYAAALLDNGESAVMTELVSDIEQGKVKALIVVESDPFYAYPQPERLDRALDQLDFLLVIGYMPGRLVEKAHIFLPATTIYEMTSHYVNGQGRVQRADKIHNGGIPVRQETGGRHPPRIFRDYIPGGDPLPAWQILADILATIATQRAAPLPTAFSVLQKEIPALAAEVDFDQVHILPRHSGEKPFLNPRQRQAQEMGKHGNDGFELVLTDRTFGTEYLSAFSPVLQQVQSEPFLHMHPADADALGWRAGESIRLTVPDGHELILPLETAPRMARGVLIVARHRNIQWQRLLAFEGWVPTAALASRQAVIGHGK